MDELPQESRELLDAARAALSPTAADRARIWASIESALGGGGGPDGDGGAADPSTSPSPSTPPAQGSAGTDPTSPGSPVRAWWSKGLFVVAVLGLVGGGAIGIAIVDSLEPRPSRGMHLVVGEPEVVPGEEPTIEAPPVAAEREPRRRSTHAVGRGVGAGTGADDLEREVALLHAAQAAWRGGRTSEALRLLDEHRAAFPRSALAYERDALRVLSLCAVGREEQARRLGARLLERSGSSPWRRALEQSCAGR